MKKKNTSLVRVVVFTVFMICLFSQNVNAFIYRSGEVVKGFDYKGNEREFSICASIEDNIKYLYFKGETDTENALVKIKYSEALRDSLINAVLKSFDWSVVAIKNEVDVLKKVGCFGECSEKKILKNQMRFYFISKGKYVALGIYLVDMDDVSNISRIILNGIEILSLLSPLDQIEETFEKCVETINNQSLFK